MADNTQQPVPGTPGQGAGVVPAEQSGLQPAGQQGQQPAQGTQAQQYVTADQFDAFQKKVLGTVQSMVNKGENRIATRMQEFEKSMQVMKAAGQQFTPEQEQALRSKVFTAAVSETPSEQQPTTQAAPVQVPQQGQQAADPIQASAQQIQQTNGVTLVDGDPELANIVLDKGPWEYLKSIEAACLAKKQRTASTTNPQPEAPGLPAGRLPLQGTTVIPNYTPEEKIAMGVNRNK